MQKQRKPKEKLGFGDPDLEKLKKPKENIGLETQTVNNHRKQQETVTVDLGLRSVLFVLENFS